MLVGEDGRTALLDTVLAIDDVGLIIGEESNLPESPSSSESAVSFEPTMSESIAAPRSQSVGAAPVPSGPCVNINSADERQLVTLRGIGPATAAAIIAHRDQHGAFRKKEDIQRVRGIGPAKFAQVVDDICL
jgi:competence ComEA-like helix-hairpin-helix protein